MIRLRIETVVVFRQRNVTGEHFSALCHVDRSSRVCLCALNSPSTAFPARSRHLRLGNFHSNTPRTGLAVCCNSVSPFRRDRRSCLFVIFRLRIISPANSSKKSYAYFIPYLSEVADARKIHSLSLELFRICMLMLLGIQNWG